MLNALSPPSKLLAASELEISMREMRLAYVSETDEDPAPSRRTSARAAPPAFPLPDPSRSRLSLLPEKLPLGHSSAMPSAIQLPQKGLRSNIVSP